MSFRCVRVPLMTGAVIIWILSATSAGAARDLMSQVHSWGYQLQEADPATVAASSYDLVVIDYARDGTDGTAYSAGQIQQIRNGGKIVLAYLSIGEAEDYRFYWQPQWRPGQPSWLGPENPDWPGNYEVQYWQPEWWRIAIRPYLDKILAAGFDGVYLDIIDGYWFWHESKGFSLPFTANRMVILVNKIARYCRTRALDFIVCPQNGASIIADAVDPLDEIYLEDIDAIGVEDLFYHFGSPQDQQYRMDLLQRFAQEDKRILNVEYISAANWPDYETDLCAAPFPVVGYAAQPDRALDELNDFPRVPCGEESRTETGSSPDPVVRLPLQCSTDGPQGIRPSGSDGANRPTR